MKKPIFGTDPSAVNMSRYREAALHGVPKFPMRVYANNFDWYADNIIDWHWHPEIEIAVVLAGRVVCCINDNVIEVTEGEGFFINSNTMHMEQPAGGNDKPLMATVCFMPEFIGDCGSDLIYTRYIEPLVSDPLLRGVKLSGDIRWQAEVLEKVRELFALSQSRCWGYELKSRNIIAELWYTLAYNLHPAQSAGTAAASAGLQEQRLKEMLSCIHENYRNELSVDKIASAANISRSECFRCFRSLIGKKPVAYLNEYRLKKAAELLIDTDMSVTEVCFSSGFNHISYFGKVFHKYYGVTPKQFRYNEKPRNSAYKTNST